VALHRYIATFSSKIYNDNANLKKNYYGTPVGPKGSWALVHRTTCIAAAGSTVSYIE